MNRYNIPIAFGVAGITLLSGCGGSDDNPPDPRVAAVDCASLASVQLPNTTIASAEAIPAGTYKPPGSSVAFSNLPAFCRITATSSPVADSSIGLEMWLPTSTWNGKYQQSGMHGFGGTFYWAEMVTQIQRGYATGITDSGHGKPGVFDVAWAFGHPEKLVDFDSRSVHELADKSKLMIAKYYGRPQRYAYYNGCSDGGRDGVKSALLYPKDFDGIIAGGAAANWTGSATVQMTVTANLKSAGIQGTSGANLLTLAQNAATAACDASDGVTDGLIGDPRRCTWDPATLVCKAGQDPATCLSPVQATALAQNYGTLVDPVSGQYIMAGMPRGSEFDQIRFGFQNALSPFPIANYRIALNNPNWDGSTFNLRNDYPLLGQKLGFLNATDADYSKFKAAGGKLIQWHGWSDSQFPPQWIAQHYEDIVATTGKGDVPSVQQFYRLFMMPGVGHCGGGPGPDNIGAENQIAVTNDPAHDVVSALEAWVESGTPPDRLIATKYSNNDPARGIAMQRPLCPYPSEAIYKGTGDTNDAANFACRVR